MTPTQPTRVTPRPFGPRPPLGGRNRLRPLVAQPIHGLVIAPHVADRAPLEEEATPICASVEQDLHLSFDELTEPRASANRPQLRALEHSDALDESDTSDVADPVVNPDPDIEQPDTGGEPESAPEPETQPDALPETQPGSGDGEEPIAPQPDTDTIEIADTGDAADAAGDAADTGDAPDGQPQDEDRPEVEASDEPEPPASA